MTGGFHVQNSIEEDAARVGFVKRRIPPDYRQVQWYLKCSKCPRDFSANWNAGTKPDFMIKNMRTRQWDVDYGMRPLCPDCAHKKDKGPTSKPESQSFKPYIVPSTMIKDQLLNAAEKRSHDIARDKAWATVRACDRELADMKAEKHEITAEVARNEKMAAMQARARHAGAMRLKRIEEEKAAREAGAEALRIAQMKERACPQPPVIAPQIEKAPQAEEEVTHMTIKPVSIPSPKITHAVFQCLDGVFDPAKRLYRSGYTDQRVAKECGTHEDVVAYLRSETFGALAEDPRYSAMRDDMELFRMESADAFAKLQKQLGELASRLEQLAHAR